MGSGHREGSSHWEPRCCPGAGSAARASCLFSLFFFTYLKRIWVFCWTRLLRVVLLELLLWVLRWVGHSSPHGTGSVVKVLRAVRRLYHAVYLQLPNSLNGRAFVLKLNKCRQEPGLDVPSVSLAER